MSSYLFLEAGFLDHFKFVRAVELASSHALHLWLGLMCYCKEKQTDGIVPRSMVGRVNGPPARWRPKALAALIDAGLIEPTDEGYLVHDFLEWNFSIAEIRRRAEVRKSRRPGAAEGSRPSLRTRGERSGERVVTVAASVVANDTAGVVRLSSRPQAVSQDIGGLHAVGSVHGDDRGDDHASRARPRSGSGSGSEDLNPPFVPPQTEPEPPAQTASTSSAKARRVRSSTGQTQCPLDFKPDDTTQAKATSLGFSSKLELETREVFIDWWRGKKRAMGDWQATYRNWLRREAKTLGLTPPKPLTQQQLEWLERKRRAEEAPKNPVANAREKLAAATRDLFAAH